MTDQLDGLLPAAVKQVQMADRDGVNGVASKYQYRRFESQISRGGHSSRGGSRAGSRMQVIHVHALDTVLYYDKSSSNFPYLNTTDHGIRP